MVPIQPVIIPAVANPEPVSVPAELRILVLPIFPQMMAGIPERNPKQTRLRIPIIMLAMARPELSGAGLELGAGFTGGSGLLMVSFEFGSSYLLLMRV